MKSRQRRGTPKKPFVSRLSDDTRLQLKRLSDYKKMSMSAVVSLLIKQEYYKVLVSLQLKELKAIESDMVSPKMSEPPASTEREYIARNPKIVEFYRKGKQT